MVTILLCSLAFCFGFLMCAVLVSNKTAEESQMYEMGIILRDKTIHNQKLKICEQAEKIANLSSKLQLQSN